MFAQLAVLAAFVPLLASALTVDPLIGATSGGRTNITWAAFEGDPTTFSVELRNPTFNNHFAIANNVDASLQRMEVLLPIVPAGEQYFLDVVDIGNITNVFATSAPFTIGDVVSTSTSSTGTGTSTGTTRPPTATGTVISQPTQSIPTVTPGTSANTGSGTGTATTSIGTTTPFNNDNGAVALGSGVLNYGLMAVAALVGATLVGF